MRGKTAEDRRLLELLDPVARAAGFEIVRLRLMGGAQTRRLQIMAEREDGSMVVEDCAQLARAMSPVLDDADPVAGDYTLEVSSPGIDRPLTRLADFIAYEGFEARLELDRLAEGRKRFRGELAGVEDGLVGVNLEGETATAMLPFEWLIDARLVINDALLAHGAAARAGRLDIPAQTLDGAPDVAFEDVASPDAAVKPRAPIYRPRPPKGPKTKPRARSARALARLEDQKD